MMFMNCKTVALVVLTLLVAPVGAETRTMLVAGGKLRSINGVELLVVDQNGRERRSDSGIVDLAAGDIVTCRGDGLWCPRIRPDTPDQERIVVPVYPRAFFTATLELPRGEHWSDETLAAELWLEGREVRFTEVVTTTASGEEIEAAWVGPAATLDLRVVADRWIPEYRFDVEADSGSVALGVIRMARGASLSGFVVDGQTGSAIAGASVSLRQTQIEHLDQRAERLRVHSRTTERGFVQLHGVAPGMYDLVVEADRRPVTRIRDVEMVATHETWLGNVEMGSYGAFTTRVDPPSDNGQPWGVEITARERSSAALHEGQTDPHGVAVLRGVSPGPYWIHVRGARGELVFTAEHWIAGDDGMVATLNRVPLRGKVMSDQEGVAATVEVTTTSRLDRVSFRTDSDGWFGGLVPEPEDDSVRVYVVADNGVERHFTARPVFRDGAYEIVLELGSHEIRGHIVDGDLIAPVEDARVSIWRRSEDDAPGRSLPQHTGPDGAFAFRGLPAGHYDVAVTADHYFEPPDVRVSTVEMVNPNDPADDLTVLLHRGSPVRVRVSADDGTPHRRAEVRITVMGPDGVRSGKTFTDLQGRAEVMVRRGVGPASVVVYPPAGLLWSGCAVLPLDDTEFSLVIPATGGGTVVMRPGTDEALSEPALLATSGGLLKYNDLILWALLKDDVMTLSTRVDRVSRVAPGQYAVVDAPLGIDAYAMACQGAVQPSGSWGFLPVGGQLEMPTPEWATGTQQP